METLTVLTTAELKKEWAGYFKHPPPKRSSRELMLGHIVWKKQAKQHGGLSRKSKGQLKQLMQQLRDGVDLTPEHSLLIKSGTRLIRNYQGVKHEVLVIDGGFEYKGKIYRSLSGVANHITGSKWNGKLFFGVKQ